MSRNAVDLPPLFGPMKTVIAVGSKTRGAEPSVAPPKDQFFDPHTFTPPKNQPQSLPHSVS